VLESAASSWAGKYSFHRVVDNNYDLMSVAMYNTQD
jgi:hypothetical protein